MDGGERDVARDGVPDTGCLEGRGRYDAADGSVLDAGTWIRPLSDRLDTNVAFRLGTSWISRVGCMGLRTIAKAGNSERLRQFLAMTRDEE